MMQASRSHEHFIALVNQIEQRLAAHEIALTSYSSERSDFIRFNEGKVRQTGHVSQASLTLRLIDGQRQAYATLTPTGDMSADAQSIAATLTALREGLHDAPDDPHLLFDTTVWSESTQRAGTLPSPDTLPLFVAECSRGLDFVGFYAGGTMARGFASSLGSRGWYEVENFNFSWSLYDASGRAIKSHYAGDTWSDTVFASKLEEAAARLPIFTRQPRILMPGRYRTYFAPAALQELMETASLSAFSARMQATARNEFYRLNTGEVSLDPRVTLTEDLSLDITPRFNGDGYQRQSVQLVKAGHAVSQLTNARTAREYGLTPNGATAGEAPAALSMQGGDLEAADVLRALDTGLYIGNLWYVNFSDRMNCRMTGMTRFATFWVEHGRIVAPVDAMRFDDSLYRLLGSELERIGAAPELLLNDWTWGERATGGMKLPGLLVRSFELTL
ncbi:TldE/PmbA family protein, Beta/Gamma-proteobacterial subgroup [Paraburkholderia sabiae]|uniref:TldD/PmbA family protein n=1 Tax=Paraburkholderia sabiae TaxID=273251 RepID=UPI001CB37945|nr:metallopeptidase TldD-related protein [Paraburkholderia sabiae]CAG9210215.1 TldE/PmbA family protein, Beta/Gamma-proteobacterial subgroup [Paraburkholderia sabiae]